MNASIGTMRLNLPAPLAIAFEEAEASEPGNRETAIGMANALRLAGRQAEAAAWTRKNQAFDTLRRRLAEVRSDDDVDLINEELLDRYGEPPVEVVSLLLVAGYLRAVGGKLLFRVAVPAQLIYLMLFSLSFFFDGLTGIDGVIQAPYCAKRHWVRVGDLDAFPEKDLSALVRHSYDLVVAKLPKKVQATLPPPAPGSAKSC